MKESGIKKTELEFIAIYKEAWNKRFGHASTERQIFSGLALFESDDTDSEETFTGEFFSTPQEYPGDYQKYFDDCRAPRSETAQINLNPLSYFNQNVVLPISSRVELRLMRRYTATHSHNGVPVRFTEEFLNSAPAFFKGMSASTRLSTGFMWRPESQSHLMISRALNRDVFPVNGDAYAYIVKMMAYVHKWKQRAWLTIAVTSLSVIVGLAYVAYKELSRRSLTAIKVSEGSVIMPQSKVPRLTDDIYSGLVLESAHVGLISRHMHAHQCETCGSYFKHMHGFGNRIHKLICTQCVDEKLERLDNETTEQADYLTNPKTPKVKGRMSAQIEAKTSPLSADDYQAAIQGFPKEVRGEMFNFMADASAISAFRSMSHHILTIYSHDIYGSVCGIAIGGHSVLTVNHLFPEKTKLHSIQVDSLSTANIHIKLQEKDILRFPERDLAIFQLPDHIPMFRSVLQHFIDEEQVKNFDSGFTSTVIRQGGTQMVYLGAATNIEPVSTAASYWLGEETIEISQSFTYTAVTFAGMCGSPLFVNDKSTARKIAGVHVSGDTSLGTGRCSYITHAIASDMFEKARNYFGKVSLLEPPKTTTTQMNCPFANDAADILGAFDPNDGGSRSQFVPSLLHGHFGPVKTAPAVLHPQYREGELVDPIEKGLRASIFARESYAWEEDVDRAESEFLNQLSSLTPYPLPSPILTIDETVNGIRATDGSTDHYIGPIVKTTSPGYPLNKNRTARGKYDYLDERPDGTFELHDDLVQEILSTERKIEKSEPVTMPVYLQTPKDELRPFAKIEAVKTRIFSNGPLAWNLLFRRYFCVFQAFLMHNHNTHEAAVGINPSSDDWGELRSYLKFDDPQWKRWGGDYENWDKRMSFQFSRRFFTIANAWYGRDGFEAVRRFLPHAALAGAFSFHKMLYVMAGVIPSGLPMTAILNSVVNSIVIRVCYLRCARAANVDVNTAIARFKDLVRLKVYGDDHIIAVHSSIQEWFNMINFASAVKELGMGYTDHIKRPVTTAFIEDDELTFLKRSFRFSHSTWFAPLDIDSLFDILNWQKRGLDKHFAILASFRSFQIECVHYGSAFYDEWITKVTKALVAKRVDIQYESSAAIFGRVWGKFAAFMPLTLRQRLSEVFEVLVRLEKHHIFSISRNHELLITEIKWCPLYSNIECALGGIQLLHHICPRCSRQALYTFRGEGRVRLCLNCLGEDVPQWYFHVACEKCLVTSHNANAITAASESCARDVSIN